MDDQNEILQLRKEISRLQAQLKAQQAPVPVRSDTASLIENHELITDCCRFSEGLLTERDVRKKWRLTEDVYTKLGGDEAFIEKVEAEKVRRTRSGATARERAQQVFVETPAVLGEILRDNNASPRHRIEASREIRAVAATGPEAQSPTEMFHITINLGDDYKLQVSQPIRPTPGNNEIIEQKAIPMIEDGDGKSV